MDELKKNDDEELNVQDSAKQSPNRVKRMRGWLGVKSNTSMGDYYDNGEAPVYGDGHSGWNR